MKRTTGYCDPERLARAGYGDNVEVVSPPPGEEPNVVTSFISETMRHAPVIDIDHPVWVVPSSTPGHFHLFIDVEIPGPLYFELLDVMMRCGIVQQGFVHHSEMRGQSVVRMPWVSKEPPEPVADLEPNF